MKARKWIFPIFLLFLYLFFEGLCYLGLLVLEKVFDTPYDPNVSVLSAEQKASLEKFLKNKQGERVGQDGVLGWVPTAEANSGGMRDNREHERVPSPGTIRISAFGDSFTYGSDVALNDTWAAQLETMVPCVEILNYGVGAYGLDQAYLRYLQVGTTYHPHIVFIGYMSENVARNVNVFRAFYTRWYRNVIFTKPRFQVKNGELVLLNNPLFSFEDYERFLLNDREVLAKLGENDYHYQTNYNNGPYDRLPSVRLAKIFWATLNKRLFRPIFTLDGMYNERSEAYEVTVKIFDAFYRKVLENGALPIILVFPDLHDQRRSRQKQARRYTSLLTQFRAKQYRFVDTLGALEPYESRYTIDELVEKPWGHYSPLGNKIIAEYIATQMKNWEVTDQSKLQAAIKVERQRLGMSD